MFSHTFQCDSHRCLALAAGTVLSVYGSAGDRLHCQGGRILLSQFNVVDDFDLGSGMSITLQMSGRVVIEAIEASVVCSIVAEKKLHQAIEIALTAQRWANVGWRHFKQVFTLRRQQC